MGLKKLKQHRYHTLACEMRPHLPPENGSRMPSFCNTRVLVVREVDNSNLSNSSGFITSICSICDNSCTHSSKGAIPGFVSHTSSHLLSMDHNKNRVTSRLWSTATSDCLHKTYACVLVLQQSLPVVIKLLYSLYIIL